MSSNKDKAVQVTKVVVQRSMTPAFMLGIVFLVLKLTGTVSWPWLWVTSPFWLPAAVSLVFLGGILSILAVVCLAIGVLTVISESRK